MSGLERSASRAVEIALLLAPWAGVGVLHLATGRVLGTGIQPAFLPLLFLVPACAWWARSSAEVTPRTVPWSWILVLGWTLATTTLLWTFDHMGMAGEAGWSKSLKQFVMLGFFVLAALAVHAVGLRIDAAARVRWERSASIGLALAVGVAMVQALAFDLPLPGAAVLAQITSSNPSIASGSEELYLGHRFVGIARLRGPMPEPLLFGSYLLAAVPITAAAAVRARGAARWWRAAVALLGALCLVATFSRGAWLGAAVTAGVLGLGSLRGILARPTARQAGVGAAVLMALFGVGAWALTGRAPWELPELLLSRLTQTAAGHDMSNLTRFWSWATAWRLFTEAPLTGVGWGGFGLHFYAVAPAGADGAHFGWPVTNSLPLLVLAETGIIGLSLWIVALWPSLRALVAPRPGPAAFVLAAVCAGLVAQGLTFSQWNLPHLWLVMACSGAWWSKRDVMV